MKFWFKIISVKSHIEGMDFYINVIRVQVEYMH